MKKPTIHYAPLAGCTDYPFRQMSAKWKPHLMFCEMVKMDALVRYDKNTFHILDYDDTMRPIGAQICGSKLEIAAQSAKMIEDLGFDVLDLNCGCPVDKVTKDGSGSGMLKHPELIGEVLSTMVNAVKIPVTVKIRAGWDENSICAPQITQIAEAAGAQAIAIHGRTREQGYSGPADWKVIKEAKQVAKKIRVIGNGDVIDADSAWRMWEETGCDAVLVARGTLGQPWVFEDILRRFNGEETIERTPEECRQMLYEHFQMIKRYHPERKAIVEMRRVGCWYIKKSRGTREFRHVMARAQSLEEIEQIILNFPIGEMMEETCA